MNSNPADDAPDPHSEESETSGGFDQWVPEGAALADMLAEGALPKGERIPPDGGSPETPEFPGAGTEPGSTVGCFTLLRKLGEGGFGMVFAAEQKEPVERVVALKVIKLGMDSAEIIRRFEAERQALAMMDHPNIATVLDAGATDDGRPYFAMEYVDGIPITRHCDHERLSISARLVLFLDVCAAIQHAHQKGIIHRDIKPSNILVAKIGERPVIKVIDFGIAKALERRGGDTVTTAGELIGTPQYMSPEQARGSGPEIDTRCDIYALGAVLYELLTGFTPLSPAELDRAALAEIQRLISEHTPSRPSVRVREAPANATTRITKTRGATGQKLGNLLRGDLDWIVMKALEKEPGRRYESAGRFAEDLQRHLRNDPVAASPPSHVYILRKFILRHRLAVSAGLAILVSLVGGATVSTRLYLREKAARADAVRAFEQMDAERIRADRERVRADREARDASAVSQFLTKDMLGDHAMSSGTDPNIALRSVIAAAEKKLHERFADRPVVEARIRAALAGAYESMGLYAAALSQARRAGDLFHQALDPTNRTILDSQLQIAWMQSKIGDHDAAELAYERCVATARSILPKNDPAWIDIHNNRATAYAASGRHAEAESAFRKVLESFDLTSKPDRVRTLIFRRNLSSVLSRQGKFAEALPIMEEIVRLSADHLGELHVETVKARYLLAGIKKDLGRHAEAMKELEITLRQFRQLVGADHVHSMENLNTLATLYAARGKTNDAIAIRRDLAYTSPSINRLRAQLAGLRQAGRTNQIPFIRSLRDLGFRLNDFGLRSDAEAPFREILATIPMESPGSWRRHEAEFQLGHLLQAQGKTNEARPFVTAGVQGVWTKREIIAKSGAAVLIPIVLGKSAGLLESMGAQDEAAKWRQRLSEYQAAGKKK